MIRLHVSTDAGDRRWDASLGISRLDWLQAREIMLVRLGERIDELLRAADQAERDARFAAGPGGKLP